MLASQIETPALILDLEIFERNLNKMQSFAVKREIALRPENTVYEEYCTILGGKDFKVGDKLYMIPGHCCTTVNLHDSIYFVRNRKVVDRIPVTSRGKSM